MASRSSSAAGSSSTCASGTAVGTACLVCIEFTATVYTITLPLCTRLTSQPLCHTATVYSVTLSRRHGAHSHSHTVTFYIVTATVTCRGVHTHCHPVTVYTVTVALPPCDCVHSHRHDVTVSLCTQSQLQSQALCRGLHSRHHAAL